MSSKQSPSSLCEQTQEAILALLDNEFVPEQQAILSEHLPQCADCQAYQASMEHLTLSIRKLNDVRVPEGLEARIMNRISAKSKVDETSSETGTSNTIILSRKNRWPKMAPIAAAVMTLALALPLVYQALNPGTSLFEAPGNKPAAQQTASAATARNQQTVIPTSSEQSPIDLQAIKPDTDNSGSTNSDTASQPKTSTEVASSLPAAMNVENTYASNKENDIYFDPLSNVVDF